MKALTEFNVFNINRGIAMKNELTTAGKTPEEVQTGIGESFKLEGDKLKYFMNSLDVVAGKADGLKRVFVASFAEGEAVPDKAQKVEEQYYIMEYFTAPYVKKVDDSGKNGKGRGGRDGGRGGGGGRGPGGAGRGPGGDRGNKGPAQAGATQAAAPAKEQK